MSSKICRADDYRIQLEQERIQNDQLLHENERLHQQFETNIRESEQIYKSRERVRIVYA